MPSTLFDLLRGNVNPLRKPYEEEIEALEAGTLPTFTPPANPIDPKALQLRPPKTWQEKIQTLLNTIEPSPESQGKLESMPLTIGAGALLGGFPGAVAGAALPWVENIPGGEAFSKNVLEPLPPFIPGEQMLAVVPAFRKMARQEQVTSQLQKEGRLHKAPFFQGLLTSAQATKERLARDLRLSLKNRRIEPREANRINELINSRDSVFHSTDSRGFEGILDSGVIAVNPMLHQGLGKKKQKEMMAKYGGKNLTHAQVYQSLQDKVEAGAITEGELFEEWGVAQKYLKLTPAEKVLQKNYIKARNAYQEGMRGPDEPALGVAFNESMDALTAAHVPFPAIPQAKTAKQLKNPASPKPLKLDSPELTWSPFKSSTLAHNADAYMSANVSGGPGLVEGSFLQTPIDNYAIYKHPYAITYVDLNGKTEIWGHAKTKEKAESMAEIFKQDILTPFTHPESYQPGAYPSEVKPMYESKAASVKVIDTPTYSVIDQGDFVDSFFDLDKAKKTLLKVYNDTISVDDLADSHLPYPSDNYWPGVSVARWSRVAPKADKPITFVLDRKKLPPYKPIAERGYRKTREFSDYGQPNPHFEAEFRTLGQDISLDAVKGVIVDEAALEQSYPRMTNWERIAPYYKTLANEWLTRYRKNPAKFDVLNDYRVMDVARNQGSREAVDILDRIPMDTQAYYDKLASILTDLKAETSPFERELSKIQSLAKENGFSVKVLPGRKATFSYRSTLGRERNPANLWSVAGGLGLSQLYRQRQDDERKKKYPAPPTF